MTAKRARAAIFEAIRNQIESGDPPETRLTMERLVAQGYSKDEAMNLIAAVVVTEVFEIMRHDRPHDEERFVTALRALPNAGKE